MGLSARWSSVSSLVAALGLVSSASSQLVLESNHPVAADVFAEPGFVIDQLPFPLMDLRTVREDDARNLAQGDIPRFAIPNDVNITPLDAGSMQDIGNGKVAWRLRLECANAVNMNIGTLWNVPASTRMFLLDAEGFTPYGAFTAADNHDHGQLWTPIVHGSVMEVYVELDAKDWEAFAAGFTIIRVSTGYRHFGEALAAREQGVDDAHDEGDRSAPCNVDVACPEAYPWCLQVKGAACYTLNGSGTCSGGMLNNVREDRDPIFMTANHCGVHLNPATIVVYWNFQNAYCRVPGSADSAGNGTCGVINSGGFGCNSTTSSGCALIATDAPADWTMTRLSVTPPDSYKVVYLGWDIRDSATAIPASGFGVHHPGVQEKRISVEFHPFVAETRTFSGGLTIMTWRLQYDIGGVEPGSSGSPVFNQDGRVVGTATSADPRTIACFPQVTWYGRLDVAYNNVPAFRTAIDPDNTGAQTLDLKQFFANGAPDTFGFRQIDPAHTASNVSRTPTLIWGGACGADEFRLRVSQSSDLSSPLIDVVLPSNQTTYIVGPGVLNYSQVYYWGVTATNELGTVNSTPIAAQFTVQPQPLGNFTLSSPSNGAIALPTDPEFQWGASTNAVQYRLEVDEDPAFGSPVTVLVNAPITQTTFAPGTLAFGTQYFWKVTAIKAPDELESVSWSFYTQSAPRDCPGDVTRDGFTNISDFNVMAGHFGQAVGIGVDGDLNDDLFVNISDFNILAGDYGCGL